MTVYNNTGSSFAQIFTNFSVNAAGQTLGLRGIQCNGDSGSCFLEPDTRGTRWVVDCDGASQCVEFKLRFPDANVKDHCLANVGTGRLTRTGSVMF